MLVLKLQKAGTEAYKIYLKKLHNQNSSTLNPNKVRLLYKYNE